MVSCRPSTYLVSLVAILLVSNVYAQTNANAEVQLPPALHPDAVRLMDSGQPRDALAVLENAGGRLELESLILRATLRRHAGQSAEAEADWRGVIDRAVFMRTFARRALVTILVSRGALAEAESILEHLLRSDTARHRDLLLRVADAHRETGSVERAATTYRRVLSSTTVGASADAARQVGLAYHQPTTLPAFETALAEAVASGRSALIEVRTDRVEQATLRRDLARAVAEAVDDAV